MASITRRAYADMYGPTTGDRVRLGDTELWIEVERDHAHYGEEVKVRRRQGHPRRHGAKVSGGAPRCSTRSSPTRSSSTTGASSRQDIGLRHGRIVGIGKAGNPDRTTLRRSGDWPGHGDHRRRGPDRDRRRIDSHIHFICPQQIDDALMSGTTTMIGGGTGPAAGTSATTCTPGPWYLAQMLRAADGLPMNLGFLGKGNASLPDALEEQVRAGAIGSSCTKDWGTTPAPSIAV
jgi:urease subunit alpha